MKLAISNIAWYPKELDSFLDFISHLNLDGLEIAASMLWDEPVLTSASERKEVMQKIEDAGLQCTGLHALLYTHPELVLFGDARTRSMMIEYLIEMMDICRDLGGEVLVYGSPKSRMKYSLSQEKAEAIAIDFFKKIGAHAAERGVSFCIEPLGKTETDFINTTAQAEQLMADAGWPQGLGLHVDAKALVDSNEVDAPDLVDRFSRARHVHVNDPNLLPLGSTAFDHAKISRTIQKSGYSRYISIEMRRVDGDVEGAIQRAVEYVQRIYLGGR